MAASRGRGHDDAGRGDDQRQARVGPQAGRAVDDHRPVKPARPPRPRHRAGPGPRRVRPPASAPQRIATAPDSRTASQRPGATREHVVQVRSVGGGRSAIRGRRRRRRRRAPAARLKATVDLPTPPFPPVTARIMRSAPASPGHVHGRRSLGEFVGPVRDRFQSLPLLLEPFDQRLGAVESPAARIPAVASGTVSAAAGCSAVASRSSTSSSHPPTAAGTPFTDCSPGF